MNGDEAPLLSVRDLKTYFMTDEGVVRSVDGVSFDIWAGKTLGVVGESGCGKSVTARSILRIVEEPGQIMDGSITFQRPMANGQVDVLDLTTLEADGTLMRSIRGSEITYVFQEPMTSFSPVHTIGNQIIEAISIHLDLNKQAARQRAIDVLGKVGIPRPEAAIDRYAFELSGGLRQRAMIAMALSCDPMLLIADEPTTALDVTTQAQILELLSSLQEQTGMAIMLITHNLGVIAEMATHVVVMYLGRVVEIAPVAELFHDPKHPYTKGLLSSIPSIESIPRTELPTISGTIPNPYNRPPGCPFYPRCSAFMPGVCDQHEPVLQFVGDEHQVSCFLYHDEVSGS